VSEVYLPGVTYKAGRCVDSSIGHSDDNDVFACELGWTLEADRVHHVTLEQLAPRYLGLDRYIVWSSADDDLRVDQRLILAILRNLQPPLLEFIVIFDMADGRAQSHLRKEVESRAVIVQAGKSDE